MQNLKIKADFKNYENTFKTRAAIIKANANKIEWFRLFKITFTLQDTYNRYISAREQLNRSKSPKISHDKLQKLMNTKITVRDNVMQQINENEMICEKCIHSLKTFNENNVFLGFVCFQDIRKIFFIDDLKWTKCSLFAKDGFTHNKYK